MFETLLEFVQYRSWKMALPTAAGYIPLERQVEMHFETCVKRAQPNKHTTLKASIEKSYTICPKAVRDS